MADPFDISESPVGEPTEIVSGSRTSWRRLVELDYVLYDILYVFNPISGGSSKQITGLSTDGETWGFVIGSVASGSWVAGEYRWDMYVVRKSDQEKLLQTTGFATVFGNASDRRTHAEIMVRKISSIIEGRAESDVESYTIKARSITKMSISELIKWRDYYMAEVSRTGGSVSSAVSQNNSTLRVRFIN